MAQATIEGKVKWFKVLGEPRENKFKNNEREWSFQIAVTSKDKLLFRQYKVKKPIKFDEEIGDYVNLSYPEYDKKSKRANPKIIVVDAEGNEWPQDKWIGNGSTVSATVDLEKYEFTKDGETISGAKVIPRKIVILDHSEYKSAGKAEPVKRVDTVKWSED